MKRALTLDEIRERLWLLDDGDERRSLEVWYWALAVERHGERRARWYREEYEWLRTRRT